MGACACKQKKPSSKKVRGTGSSLIVLQRPTFRINGKRFSEEEYMFRPQLYQERPPLPPAMGDHALRGACLAEARRH